MNKKKPNPLLPPHNIPYRLKVLTLRNDRKLLGLLEPYNLTPMQYGVLSCLWQNEGITTSELSETLKAMGGTLTVVLDGLEARGFVARVKDAEDRRISRIFLTNHGTTLKQELVPKVISLQTNMFGCLSEREKKELSRIIDKLLECSQSDQV